jgi:alcohol dehydrogenase class IV
MVDYFKFSALPQLYAGKGALGKLRDIMNQQGYKRYLLVTGKSALERIMKIPEFETFYKHTEFSSIHYPVDHEPSPSDIDNALSLQKTFKPDCIIALGGGSAIDTGKAISAMLPLQDNVLNYLEGVGNSIHPGTKLPFIAIPTTAGTGSEATKNAVISVTGQNGFKKSLRHDNFVPDYAILSPELTTTLPVFQTVFSGMDAFTQLVESFLSTNANSLTDALALEGIRNIISALPICINKGNDLASRAKVQYAAYLSGITLANAGLGTIHGFASSIGGRIDIPHGLICGTLMSTVNRKTIHKLKQFKDETSENALAKYIKLGELVTSQNNLSSEELIEAFLDFLNLWTTKFNIPKLGEYGLSEVMFSSIISHTGNKNNPVKLNEKEMLDVLRERT